jgi:hypothetical protein
MKIYLPVVLLGLLFVIRLQGADEIRYTHLVESKPVAMNGLEFVAATEDKWHGDFGGVVQIRLLIHNTTAQPMVFPAFDTFRLFVEDASGKRLGSDYGRDHTAVTKPVMIDPGQTYCLCCGGHLWWRGGSSQPDRLTAPGAWAFSFDDGTGAWNNHSPILPGKYALGFRVERTAQEPLLSIGGKELPPTLPQWSGDVTTKVVTFEVVGP